MLPSSNIKKGKRFENLINREIETEGLGRATRTPGSGSGNRLKGDSFNSLPFLLECKNQKTIHFLKDIDQAKCQAEKGNWAREKWALIIMDPRTPEANPSIYAIIDFWQFLNLLKKNEEPKVKAPDKNLKYHLYKLKVELTNVSKLLE